MKIKTGICQDCQNDGPVIAGRCKGCYWRYRATIAAAKPKATKKLEVAKELGKFFEAQMSQIPACCEECGKRLPLSPPWMRRATMAHILAKRSDYGCPSVSQHPLNIIYLCIYCHSNMDNLGESFIRKMKVYPILKERVNILLQFLNTNEYNKVPAYYL